MKTVKTVTDFLNEDYREYAVYVVEERAIPSVIDGFKPTQRKVVFIADRVWRSGSEKPLKIFQLAGKVAAESMYHHGDGSLNSAIIGMAQKFKNSMPVLEEIGQFGSLRSPEAGAPRYIATKLHSNFRLLYKDFELLESRFEEGCEIEPHYFLPIIPTVLLNGSSGIAVGFSTNILNRHPLELIDACLKSLDGKPYRDPSPWYFGFSGTCNQLEESHLSWIFRGKFEIKNTSTVEITELCPSMTYEKFDTYLDSLEESRRIVSYENLCTDKIKYALKFRREDLKSLTDSGRLTRFLKMEEKQSENFTVLDEFGKIKIFNSAREIIEYFVEFRLKYYLIRKEFLIKDLNQKLKVLSNRARFIKSIIEGTLVINNIPRTKIIENLTALNFDQVDSSFNYLLNLPIHSLTQEKYQEALRDKEAAQTDLNKTIQLEPRQMYREDLLDLRKAIVKSLP
jgi:DNA topoisomerase-2